MARIVDPVLNAPDSEEVIDGAVDSQDLTFPQALRTLRARGGTVSRQAWNGRALELDNEGFLREAGTTTAPDLATTDVSADDWWWCPF